MRVLLILISCAIAKLPLRQTKCYFPRTALMHMATSYVLPCTTSTIPCFCRTFASLFHAISFLLRSLSVTLMLEQETIYTTHSSAPFSFSAGSRRSCAQMITVAEPRRITAQLLITQPSCVSHYCQNIEPRRKSIKLSLHPARSHAPYSTSFK